MFVWKNKRNRSKKRTLKNGNGRETGLNGIKKTMNNDMSIKSNMIEKIQYQK